MENIAGDTMRWTFDTDIDTFTDPPQGLEIDRGPWESAQAVQGQGSNYIDLLYNGFINTPSPWRAIAPAATDVQFVGGVTLAIPQSGSTI